MKRYTYLFALLFTFFVFKSHAQCIFTVAGNGSQGFAGDSGPATAASLYYATGVALDPAGNIYIADQQNMVIRKVTKATGIITTIAGQAGYFGSSGDGGPASAAFLNWPSGLAYYNGSLYIADQVNDAIRKIDLSTDTITTIAGTCGTPGFSGDGNAATGALLYHPTGLTFDNKGNMFIADATNNRIREVATSGVINTVAGNGTAGYFDSVSPLLGELNNPTGVAVDASGNIYIADENNNRIRKVSVITLLISTIAGNGTAGYGGDGAAASGAILNNPIGITLDASGNFYIADEGNYRIRKINTAGVINTIAGNGVAGYAGDYGPATAAMLWAPWAVALDAAGNIFIPDNFNNVVREVRQCNGIMVSITPSDSVVICRGSSTTLTASGDSSYTWKPAIGLNTTMGAYVIASPTVTTTYTVTGKPGGLKDSIIVRVLPTPTVTINSKPISRSICAGGKDTIIATIVGAASYTWSPSISNVSTTSSVFIGIVSPTVTTTYSLIATGPNGCTTTDTITVNVSTIHVSPTSATICPGGIDTLYASGGLIATYKWGPSTGLSSTSGASVTVSPPGTITYSVTGTTSLGCKATATATITVASPTISVTASPPTICLGSGSKLTASGAATYKWAPTTGLNATTGASVIAMPSGTGTYTYT
ncbi:MAG TPA: hypothetical protein VK890_02075, partial [Bacteroidia bacterium]|nr:hypothetical protein [Bacteroidia bacterium]